MPWWVAVLYRVPFVDRFACEWMWFHGGFLVLPADHPFHERYGPEAYEALTGISKHEYEHQVLEVARAALRDVGGAVTIEALSLEGEGLDVEIVVLFRLADRPGARFGSRWQLWPSPHPDDYEGTPEWGTLLPTFIAIDVAEPSRLAGQPDAGGIIWIRHE